LKLRYSRLWEINCAKTQGIITTRRVSEGFSETLQKTQKLNPSLTRFEVARFRIAVDQAGKNTGDYHNPTRQRGISRNTASTAKAQSLAHALGWDSRLIKNRMLFREGSYF
jgi:hypothetical protein